MPPFSLQYFAEKLYAEQEAIFFVQIGAMDGVSNDPIHDLVKAHGWRGILVEPMRDHFERLQQTYAGCPGLIFENAAIAEYTGAGTMYRIPTETMVEHNLPRWTLEASSFFMDRTALASESIKPHVTQEPVRCIRLNDLLVHHDVKSIDVLQLDAEGSDFKILRQLNFERFRPAIINMEIVNLPNSELAKCKQLLDKHRYLYSKTGYDLLAVAL